MEDFKEFIQYKWSAGKAYILGLTYPRIDIAKIEGLHNYYLTGSVAHNSNQINDKELIDHFLGVSKLLNNSEIKARKILIKMEGFKVLTANRAGFRRTGKKGFGVLLKLDNDFQTLDEHFENINSILTNEIQKMPEAYIKYFIAGTIDGRSSYDTTLKCISLDIDREYIKQDEIIKLIKKLKYDISVNRRGQDHAKADQLRYGKNHIEKIYNEIPLLSEYRKKRIMMGKRVN